MKEIVKGSITFWVLYEIVTGEPPYKVGLDRIERVHFFEGSGTTVDKQLEVPSWHGPHVTAGDKGLLNRVGY